MLYLIKSIKWTKHYKVETWWKSNRSGYTHFICNAGVYTEEDNVSLEKTVSPRDISFVPITQKVINKGKMQLKKELKGYEEDLVTIKERYENNINSTNKSIELAKSKMNELLELEKFVK